MKVNINNVVVPNASYATNSSYATNAANATNASNASLLGGLYPSQFFKHETTTKIDFSATNLGTGFYQIPGTGDGQNKSQLPVQGDGQMLLHFNYAWQGYIAQFLFTPTSDIVYFRRCNNKKWDDWKKVSMT